MSWTITTLGFVSVVYKGGGLQVRSRDLESIETFCDVAKVSRDRIVTGGGTDYQYRVRRVSKRDVKRYYCAIVDGINYSNFKDEAKRVRGKKYAGALSRVWGVMWDLAPKSAYDDYLKPIYSSTTGSGSSGRWGTGGAWSSMWGERETQPVPDSESLAMTIETLREMSGDELTVALDDLEFESEFKGDEHARALLEEWDAEQGELLSVSNMTDEQFAEFERGDRAI